MSSTGFWSRDCSFFFGGPQEFLVWGLELLVRGRCSFMSCGCTIAVLACPKPSATLPQAFSAAFQPPSTELPLRGPLQSGGRTAHDSTAPLGPVG